MKTLACSKKLNPGLCMAIAGFCLAPAEAVLIQPDTATASSYYDANYDPGNTIDGSGLPAGFGPADAHAAYSVHNHWTTFPGTQPGNAWIAWGFNTAQTLDRIHVWNHLSTVPPAANSGYDVVLFDLTLFDAADSVLLHLEDVPLAPDTSTGQTFLFGGPISGVRSVRFDVEQNQSPTAAFPYTGLAEVAFENVPAAVPESGSTLVLAAMAVLAISAARLNAKEIGFPRGRREGTILGDPSSLIRRST